jgi:hypothetical protein
METVDKREKKSGLLAATSVIKARRNNNQPSHLYLDHLKELTLKIEDLCTHVKKILGQKNENEIFITKGSVAESV